MSGGDNLDFEIRPNPAPVADAERDALLANPGFGRVVTDHMVTIRYAEGKGWYEPRVEARCGEVLVQTPDAGRIFVYIGKKDARSRARHEIDLPVGRAQESTQSLNVDRHTFANALLDDFAQEGGGFICAGHGRHPLA